jgi:hypothetical protein
MGNPTVIGESADAALDDDEVLPFATEVGKGVAFDKGFAAGALRKEGRGTGAVVAVVAADGSSSRIVSLGASHGDADPPRVFAAGSALGAGVLAPMASGRALRLARIDGDSVAWGAELAQGADESLAFDVALGEGRGVAVWDDVPKDKERSAIFLATFDPATFAAPGLAHVVTLPGTDADLPRLVVRPGGFWLLWVARRPEGSDPDARFRAEDIAYRWLEVVPLDARGGLTGAPRRIGSDSGHVLAYDVVEGQDGAAIVMWRDDDTPSGSAGGRLLRAVVRLGGIDGPDPIDDEHVGVGAPSLMPGWLAIADAAGPTRLVPMGPRGLPLDRLESEPSIGSGEPLAAIGDRLLVARFSGNAVRLLVARCSRATGDASRD